MHRLVKKEKKEMHTTASGPLKPTPMMANSQAPPDAESIMMNTQGMSLRSLTLIGGRCCRR